MKVSNAQSWELKLGILEFAWKNDLMIHPDKELDGFCQRTVDMGHCICKDAELYCPCNDALDKCREQGFCTCRLFIRKDLYEDALAKAKERLGRKYGRQKSNRVRR